MDFCYYNVRILTYWHDFSSQIPFRDFPFLERVRFNLNWRRKLREIPHSFDWSPLQRIRSLSLHPGLGCGPTLYNFLTAFPLLEELEICLSAMESGLRK